ncbi:MULTISPECIES: molybdenum cofactor guanylyltransferase [unclassified Haloferax]|uniref:molybdenum cofactor guanylyltransferase n=1 Tax=Haloferax TaxID=2251 RepID=UPI0002B0A03C|nr:MULTISPECIES: molybdenum cofactor guanylyltransferase [unclassified Haloferax]ELZ60660.1 molybdopterin-guanine dinucleotide biosynthesis protein A [Haloferax sp. ATCC BAA-645]ELZ61815.1 molybdopterin-guanine dinucleotide biosynthesis protein A [Haloferax sp. ATCC BAA-646]ELZ71571.1 molybdopterin-guanine dinucleotide biosynthesis protein A [Haloferax sp. ATCC BAA-644]
MTRERQNRPGRTDAPTAAAAPSPRPAPDATAVVLAGGESTRFGPGHKALATLDGEPLIRRVVGTLRAVAGRPPIVAVRTADQRERLAAALPRDWDVRFVRDDPGLSGPLAGVAAAADTVTTSWLFVAGCDMPLLEPHAVAALFECVARRDGDGERPGPSGGDRDRPGPPAIVPVSERGHEPLHALYRRSAVRDHVSELAPDDGLGALLDRLDGVEYVGFDALPESVDRSVTNVNTRTELARVAAGDEVRR